MRLPIPQASTTPIVTSDIINVANALMSAAHDVKCLEETLDNFELPVEITLNKSGAE